jgi:hypothetical protein
VNLGIVAIIVPYFGTIWVKSGGFQRVDETLVSHWDAANAFLGGSVNQGM